MKHRIATLRAVAVLLLSAAVSALRAQTENTLPLLRMENDARTAAMAGAGAALPDNPFAICGNAAVALFGEKRSGAGLSAGALGSSGDDRLWNAAGYWSPDGRNAVLAGVRRFGGMEIPMTDNDGFPAGTARPWDLAAEAGYARIFGKRIAVSLTARYVRSDLDIGEAPFQGVSFDLAAALRGGFGKSGKAGWTAGIRVADLGPEVSGSDGRSLRLPTRGSAEGALWLTPHRNHTLRVALDLGYRFSGGPFDASFGAEYLFLRHGVIRAGYCTESALGTGGHAAAGCGFIVGPVRCDAAWRFGGAADDPFDKSFTISVGFLL